MFVWWKNLDKLFRFLIITFICSLLYFGYIYSFEADLSIWKSKEENFEALEDVIDNIIEEKNFTQPLSETLRNYKVTVNADGTADIWLNSNHVESISVTLSHDFKIIEMERSHGLIAVICTHIIVLFGFGIIASTIIHLLYYITKYIIKLIMRAQ